MEDGASLFSISTEDQRRGNALVLQDEGAGLNRDRLNVFERAERGAKSSAQVFMERLDIHLPVWRQKSSQGEVPVGVNPGRL